MDDELLENDDYSICSSSSSSSSDNDDCDAPSVDDHQISSIINKCRELITLIRKPSILYEGILRIA